MRPTDGDHADSIDIRVHSAFNTWDLCHCAVRDLRPGYDRALRHHEQEGGPEPIELRTRLRATQDECDGLFFRFLKVAEERSRARYI
ncbi:hypothetical protein [Ramlibacter algicola]|uniref:Uncharacterized protein n=1 Tax=Ramlibacter algicola TaxID=2795217 RepID=A0A934UPB6_9BURK|nr:hypothetical protein [Ramlibacter algicola]MBK0391359.1 hypothetical protein [Ramlibacter algicola]